MGDIYEAAVALFLDDDIDAIAMREMFQLSQDKSLFLYDLLSSFAQKMDFFRECCGLPLSSALSYLLRQVPSFDFVHLGFDVSAPFDSALLTFVPHPEFALRKRKNIDNTIKSTSSDHFSSNTSTVPPCGDVNDSTVPPSGVVAPTRKPEKIYYRDHRVQMENSEKTFYCDICWRPFFHQGPRRPYEGNYINKTWNTDAQKQDPQFVPVTREDLLEGWKNGVYDLTWHCLVCHAAFLGRPNDLKKLEQEMGLWRFATERKQHKAKREKMGVVRG